MHKLRSASLLDRIKFFRRRQFILGPEFIDYEGWQRLRLFENVMLTLHPDLQVTSIEHGKNKAVLLGYAIDPYQPELKTRVSFNDLLRAESL